MRQPGGEAIDTAGTGSENTMTPRQRFASHVLIVASLALLRPPAARGGDTDTDELLRFGTQMAKSGHWREAQFRWQQALHAKPDDPRFLNNLAVASEVLGAPDEARDLYRKALDHTSGDSRIEDNYARSKLFWSAAAKADETAAGHEAKAAPPAAMPPAKKKGHDVVSVTVSLPLPPRLTLDGMKSLLVASFLVNDSQLIDVNRELVRFLRSEFRKHSAFHVLDVIPIPAVPEQTLDEMAANAPFWSHMGREYGADVIVSGAMRYARRDASGFDSVDVVSETTGQKVKQTQFVQQEEFTFELDVLYLRGSDGALLFRDRLRRQATFRGEANDPISAFYTLGETLAGDVLAVVAPRARDDQRLLFKS